MTLVSTLDAVVSYAASSWIVSLLHAVWVPYAIRRAVESRPSSHAAKVYANASTLQLLMLNLILALGGGTLVKIFCGEPVGWASSNILLPTYLLGFVLMRQTSIFHHLLSSLSPLSDFTLDCLVDGVVRAFSLTMCIDSLQLSLGPSAYIGQFLFGIFSVTGGGILYNAAFANYSLSGDVGIIALAAAIYMVGLDQYLKGVIYNIFAIPLGFLSEFVGEPLGFLKFGPMESRVLATIVVVGGFVLRFRPTASPANTKEPRSTSPKRVQKKKAL